MKRILLTGPAGAGKTHALITEFRKTLKEPAPLERSCVYVLPSAEHAERIMALVLRDGLDGFFHRRITTLSRLVSELFGPGKQGVTTNVSKFLLVREVLASQEWGYFKAVQSTTGFAHLLLGFISELKESLVGVEDFRVRMNAMKGLEPAFRAKYEALAAIYERYEEGLKQRGLKDREDVIRENVLLAGARRDEAAKPFKRIWVDGFYDFSALQFASLQGLCALTDELTVTLTYEPMPEQPDPRVSTRSLFEAVMETRERLVNMGFVETHLNRRTSVDKNVRALDVLERELFKASPASSKFEAGEALEIMEAVGMEGEVEMIARHIDRAIRTGNYRASDIAILLRDVGEYEQVIQAVFRRYNIPVEIHERERLAFSPLIHTVVRLLAIFREGWQVSDLLAFLKSSYIPRIGDYENPLEWVARLENYVLRERIGEGRERLLKPMDEEELKTHGLLPGTQERLVTFGRLEDELRGAGDFHALKRVFLNALRVTFGILERSAGIDVTKRVEQDTTIRQDSAALGRLLILMDEIEMSLAGFSPPEGSPATDVSGLQAPLKLDVSPGRPPDALFEAFSERFLRLVDLDLYSLHGGDRNCVQVYSVSLAREKEYRIVFVAGLLEKKFPREMREDPILSDWERRLFNARSDTPPSGQLRERLLRQNVERYLFYLAVTRASEKLVLSYPRMDLEGKESLPSYYVEEAAGLFKAGSVRIQKQELSRPYACLGEAITRREMELGALAEFKHLTRDSNAAMVTAAVRELCRDETTRRRMEKSFYRVRDELIDPRIHAEDAFHAFKTSASRLETFAKCSFRYYAQSVLKLADPEEDRNIFARGLILHHVLDVLFKKSVKDPVLLKNTEKMLTFARREVDAALCQYTMVFEKSYRHDLEVEGVWEMLKTFLLGEQARLETSAMIPRYFEMGFGVSEAEYPAFEVETKNGKIAIRGKIDRIDVSPEGTEGLVMDYKRTATFTPSDLILGVQLQLPIYLMAMEHFLGLKGVGAELYSVKEVRRSGFYRKELMHLAGKKRAGPMTFSEEDFIKTAERSLLFIRRFAEAMQAKVIAVKPRVCEAYCTYASVCRIEKWKLPAMLEEIRAEDRETMPAFPGGEMLVGEEV